VPESLPEDPKSNKLESSEPWDGPRGGIWGSRPSQAALAARVRPGLPRDPAGQP
jgi:hypothetical protein